MSTGHVVVDGAMCKCKFGFTPDVLVVQSQTKAYINDSAASKKLIANTMDLGMPFQAKTFGQCKLQPTSSGYLPCVPAITQWQDPYDKVVLSNQGQILTEKSKAMCAIAGSPCVEFTFHGQIATGAPSTPSAEEQEALSHLDPMASEIVFEESDGALPIKHIEGDEDEDVTCHFSAYFERKLDYKGEFGFDWMRYDYKNICDDYEKLKKEYTPINVHGNEYFVPWVSMFPNQQDVELELWIEPIDDFQDSSILTEEDIIKLPAQKGIRFEPNEIVIKDTKDKDVFVKVFCDQPIEKDTFIAFKDKNNKTIGGVNFLANANHEQLKFEITPVRVLRSVSKESDAEAIENKIDQGFGDTNKDLAGDLQNLEDYLNTQSLNQALLQCKIGEVYDIIIDEQEWIDDGLIIEEGCIFKDVEILDKFSKVFKEKYPLQAKKRGLIVFLSPMKKDEAGGEGEISEIDAKRLVVYLSNLHKKDTFSHEISHVLGLTHSFEKRETEDIIFKHNKYIKEVDDYFNSLITRKFSKEELAKEWSVYKKDYKEIRSYLNTFYRNPHVFKKEQTENIMDYSSNRKTFWKFQWKAMQDDITKFYNKKQ